MPNPHFDSKVIGRNGRHRSRSRAVASSAYNAGSKVAALAAAAVVMHTSVVASAAYRSGEALYDMQVEKTYDYSHKDEVIYTAIMTPEDAPVWTRDRMFLWNHVEKTEKRKDAQLARDIIAALPRELNHEQQIALVRDFVQKEFVDLGMVADIALHDKTASDGKAQPHVHIMLTMRDITREGFGKKNRDWNRKQLLLQWREKWAETTNIHLEAAGRDERLDLRSYYEQGIHKIPGEHMGPDAWNLEEQRGIETKKGDRNREIEHLNMLSDTMPGYTIKDMPDYSAKLLDKVEEPSPADASLIDLAKRDKAGSNTAPSGQQQEARQNTPISDEELEAIHMASVRTSVQGLVHQSVRQATERIIRLRDHARAVMEKARSLAHTVFDRYAVHAMRQFGQDKDRER